MEQELNPNRKDREDAPNTKLSRRIYSGDSKPSSHNCGGAHGGGSVRGTAIRGEVNQATRIHSFADFERSFGGLWSQSEMGYAVQQYFLNGGADAFVVRAITQAVLAAFSGGPP